MPRRRTLPAALSALGLALVALPLGAQDVRRAWHVDITPFVGRGSMQALVDHLEVDRQTTNGLAIEDGKLARLWFDDAAMRGAWLTAGFGGHWSAFVELSHGRPHYWYRDSVGGGLAGSAPTYVLATSSWGDATENALALGALRTATVPLPGRPIEASAGLGASLRTLSLPRRRSVCGGSPICDGFSTMASPWDSRYVMPGASGTFALRVPVVAGVGLEARSLVTLGRADTKAFRTGTAVIPGEDLGVPSSRWVRATEWSVGVSTRVRGSGDGAPSPARGRLNVVVTPLAGLLLSSPLLDRTGSRLTDTVAQVRFTATRRIALGDAPVLGGRVELRRATWTPFLEAAAGRAPFLHTDSASFQRRGYPADDAYSTIEPRAPAHVVAAALGATRAFALTSSGLALDVGGGAAVHYYGLDAQGTHCQQFPGSNVCDADGWAKHYVAPGGAGVVGLRWTVAQRVAVEGRTTLTLVRAATGAIKPSANESYASPSGFDAPHAQWVRGARLALGVSLAR